MNTYTDNGPGLTNIRVGVMDRVEQKLFIEVENSTTKKGFMKFLTYEKAIALRDFLNLNFPDNAENKSNTDAEETAALGEGK